MNREVNIQVDPLLFFWGTVGFFTLLVIYLFVRLRSEREAKNRLAQRYNELEKKVDALDLESIRYKLNPHLFKNALNSIQSNAYQTYYSLEKLSNVLDFILYESDRQFVSLKEELNFALSLIEINRIKLSPLFDLRVKSQVSELHPFYEQELIAPLITVDLIENAFKHADLQSDGAFIAISFELTDEYFSVSVRNKIAVKSKTEKGGFGRESFIKRLGIIYKDNFKLDQRIEDTTFVSHLKINLLEHKAQMLITG